MPCGINRYIMECKLEYFAVEGMFFSELIDTLWNVNIAGIIVGIIAARINRYIMECKCSLN